jgi:hypothetical protein
MLKQHHDERKFIPNFYEVGALSRQIMPLEAKSNKKHSSMVEIKDSGCKAG